MRVFPEWIETAKQLPPDCEEVLAVWKGRIAIGMRFDFPDRARDGWKWNGTSGPSDRMKFSHWMPLPELPDTEEEG